MIRLRSLSIYVAFVASMFLLLGCSLGWKYRHQGRTYKMTNDNIEYHKRSMAEVGDIDELLERYPGPNRAYRRSKAKSLRGLARFDQAAMRKELRSDLPITPPAILNLDLSPLKSMCDRLNGYAKNSPPRDGFTNAGRLIRKDAKRVCRRLNVYQTTKNDVEEQIQALRDEDASRREREAAREKELARRKAEAERKQQERLARKEKKLAQKMYAEQCAKPTETTACDGVVNYLRMFPDGPNAARARDAQAKGAAKLARIVKKEQARAERERKRIQRLHKRAGRCMKSCMKKVFRCQERLSYLTCEGMGIGGDACSQKCCGSSGNGLNCTCGGYGRGAPCGL